MSEERICVGVVSGAFGVKGEVRIKSFTSDPAAIGEYSPLASEDGTRSWDITVSRPIKNGFAARMSGVLTKEDGDALKGVELYVPRDRFPDLPDDEFYHADLIGLEVLDTGGAELGRVTAVQNNGADDLLELRVPGKSATVLLPFTKACVPTVDIEAGRLVADPPEGLF